MPAAKQEEKATYVYVRDEKKDGHAWVPAIQLKVYNGKATVAIPEYKDEQEMLQCPVGGKQRAKNQVVDLHDYPRNVLPMQNVDANGRLEEYKDMVNLPFLHEAAILYNLKRRHINERPYTRTGDIVIATNPYKWFDELYTAKKRNYYANRLVWETSENDPRDSMEPHVYEVSALAYKGLAYEGKDQSILVSGESGAGKTETVKICLNHIASVQQGPVPEGYYDDSKYDPVVQRVVESNPLLEAFGNAKTQRNDNSSRFGKYLQLQFDRNVKSETCLKSARCGLVGSQCEVYLLEKNRVIGHAPGERNFHIFYQLLASSERDKARFWKGLQGKTPESFKYVGNTDTTKIEGLTDAEHFKKTVDALELIGVAGQNLDNLMQVICTVLQLGQIGFDGDADTSHITTGQELKCLADLMGVPETTLSLAFTERTFETRDEIHKIPLNAEGAKEACDALAKEAYQKSFLWLVEQINTATSFSTQDKEKDFGIIGLLDIFGFESFEVNRFEQLCINYANEKLQAKFTEDIFRNVQEEYKSEGLHLDNIWYDDNTDVLDLIEGRTGLLALLNEECVRPKGNDLSFVQKALQINKESPCLQIHRTDQLSFGIQHYTGPVMYDAEWFVSKNLDTLPTDLQKCAEACSNPIIRQPRSDQAFATRSKKNFGTSGIIRPRASRAESNIAAPTVWTKYKSQLNSLMSGLKKTRSRYIRCIKPNSIKCPAVMEHGLVIEQLRSCGVVAGITISRSVFPNRLDNALVLARFSSMWDHKNYPSKKMSNMNILQQRAEDCKAAMASALKDKADEVDDKGRKVPAFVVGNTRTYFRAGCLEWLESNRVSGQDAQATTIQKYARGWLVRNKGGIEQRRRYEEEQLELKRQEEEARLDSMRRESAERIQQSRIEQDILREKLADLRKRVEIGDQKTKLAIAAATKRKHVAEQENEALMQKTNEDARRKLMEPKKELAATKVKLEEQLKLIQYLKKENKKVRATADKYKEKVGTFEHHCDKLNSSNSSLSAAFETESVGTEKIYTTYDEGMQQYHEFRAKNKELKAQVEDMQEKYMEIAKDRLELQRALARILYLIQERCKDDDIVEDAVVRALQCESDCKAQMSSLEFDMSAPGLESSDISDSSALSLSNSFSSL